MNGEWVERVVGDVGGVVMTARGVLVVEGSGLGFGGAPWGVGGAVEKLCRVEWRRGEVEPSEK